MMGLPQDLRFALRKLAKAPGFTATSVLTLGLGIGAITTLVALVHGVLLQPLPYPDSDRLVRVYEIGKKGKRATQMADLNFADFAEQTHSFEGLAQYQTLHTAVSGGAEPTRVTIAQVSRDFFQVMGGQPLLGRGFEPEEQREGAPYVALLSHGFWQRYFGGDPDLASKSLRYGDQIVSLVGVMPPAFDFPSGADLWIPRELEPVTPSRTSLNKKVVARLTAEVSVDSASQDVGVVAERLKDQHGDDLWMVDAEVALLQDELVGAARSPLLVFLGAAGLLLLIACANVFNLLLAHAASRQRELAVRMALGARRLRLFRQFLTESLLLSVGGGALGVLVARWTVDLLRGLEASNLPRLAEVRVGGPVLVFVLGASTTVALGLAGLAMWRATRPSANTSLVAGQRTQAGEGATRMRGSLVVSQVALTLMLLIGTGLLLRSFQLLLGTEPGYRTTGALVINSQLPFPDSEEQAADQERFHRQLFSRLEALPGVAGLGSINYLPLKVEGPSGTFLKLNRPDEVQSFDDYRTLYKIPERTGKAQYRKATPGYFRLMEIPLLRGRLFDPRDHAEAPHVAVVSETLARESWPDEDPLGKLVQFGNMDGDLRAFTVVGVVGDIRETSLEDAPEAILYASALQRAQGFAGSFDIVVETETEPAALVSTVRKLIQEVDPQVAPAVQTLDAIFADSLARRRFQFLLLSSLGGLSLLLAAVGIYGVVSYHMALRRQELGVRIALGASGETVMRLVVRQGLLLATVGVGLGLVGALVVTRWMQSLLYGVNSTDPLTFLAVSLLLVGVAVLASLVPAYRATRIDPVQALRGE